MSVFVLPLILLLVSQHASGVQVYEGEESVLLSCQVNVSVSDRSTVKWSREELKDSTVHIRQPSGDDDADQNKLYVNRTSMKTDALRTGDLSLTLRKPTVGDSDIYTCTVRRMGQLLSQTEVQLLVTAPLPKWLWIVVAVVGPLLLLGVAAAVILGLANKAMKDRLNDQLKVVEVTEGAKSVSLTCTTKADLTGNVTVEWRRSVPHYRIIHMYVEGTNQPQEGYDGRTEMEDLLRKTSEKASDLSLNLKDPDLDDGGVYICTVYKDGEILRQKIVVLSVRETWIKTIRGLCHCCTKKSKSTAEPSPRMSGVEEKKDEAVPLKQVP